jgi:ATP-dependent Clp endopeptidase proteolytic subunit ClpP
MAAGTRPHLRASAARTLTSWYRLENRASTAAVWIYDEIGEWGVTAADFVKDLQSITAKSIDLHINSPGGNVFDGVAIYNALRNHPATVNVVVDGLAASAASFIAQAGDTVSMERTAQMMIHDAHGVALGNAGVMREMADLLDKASDNIAGIYAARSGKPAEFWRAEMLREPWYSADEAVAAGLADRIAGEEPENRAPAAIQNEAGSLGEWDPELITRAVKEALL